VEEQYNIDWGNPKLSPPATLVEPASTTSTNKPIITSSTTWGQLELELTEPRGNQTAIERERPLRARHHDTSNTITHISK
jgi:hypothetical protein